MSSSRRPASAGARTSFAHLERLSETAPSGQNAERKVRLPRPSYIFPVCVSRHQPTSTRARTFCERRVCDPLRAVCVCGEGGVAPVQQGPVTARTSASNTDTRDPPLYMFSLPTHTQSTQNTTMSYNIPTPPTFVFYDNNTRSRGHLPPPPAFRGSRRTGPRRGYPRWGGAS